MQLIISPAKTLDLNPKLPKQIQLHSSIPALIKDTCKLIEKLNKLSQSNIIKLMNVSEKLAKINYQRFQDWQYPYPNNALPAIFMFKGDVYQGIDIHSFSPTELKRLNQQLFILSGLYGILKPCDLILPYRLEMGTKLKNQVGNNLYDFWGDKIAKEILTSFDNKKKQQKKPVLINLASNEYFQVIKNQLPQDLEIIQPVFKDLVKSNYKIVSFWAKKARGLMVKFIIKNNIKKTNELTSFNLEGYFFDEKQSSKNQLVFLRNPIK